MWGTLWQVAGGISFAGCKKKGTFAIEEALNGIWSVLYLPVLEKSQDPNSACCLDSSLRVAMMS